MALGDIYEFTLRQTMFSQEILNVFHYEVTTDLGGAVTGDDLAYWVWNNFDLPLKAAQSNLLTYVQMDCLQVTGGVAIGSYAIAETGGNSAASGVQQFMAWGFRLNRSSQASRHGYKRFAGVAENFLDGTSYPGFATIATSLADAIASPVSDPDASEAGELTPCILSRYINGALRPTPLAFPVASVVFTGLTTQNTRKS